ncbi:MAG TPA: hypothetical protein VFA22_08150 [Stellaceae bacterium]|nr:hypothetical protein [Stellaceae bacterium]
MTDHPVPDRPYYFVVVLWGERFRTYFLEYCLPSLLAPGNIPALGGGGHKFLIATRPEDWAAMCATPIFRALERHAQPVFLEIPPCPPGRSGCEHMGTGHKAACEMAFRDRACAVLVTPDSMLSDGSVAHLRTRAAAGAHVVLAAALRFGEEPFLAKLAEIGAVPPTSRRATGQPLAISGRQMVLAAVNGLHSETERYEWDARSFPPYFPGVAAAAWWRVPGEDGMVLHSLSWAPLLIDYSTIATHDTTTFDQWTLDGDYIFKNFPRLEALEAITDSDDAFIASWGSIHENLVHFPRRPLFGRLGKGIMFRRAFYGPVFDPVRRRLFFATVRWHARPINEHWRAVEARANATIAWYVGPDGRDAEPPLRRARFAILSVVNAIECVRRLPDFVKLWTRLNRQRLRRLLRGDPAAIRWFWWSIRKLFAVSVRRRFDTPKPVVPGT